MEDFSLGNSFHEKKDADCKQKTVTSDGIVNMSVSPICRGKDGKQFACVLFSDGVRSAEGKIPDCTIEKNNGFAQVELESLKQCMKENLSQLKEMAAGIHVIDAFLKE